MPWARIPPERLADLPLFGIDLIVDDGDFAWYRGAGGRLRIEKAAPKVFFEEVSDAHQCGATSIIIAGANPKTDAK
jgi:hypothetical protein